MNGKRHRSVPCPRVALLVETSNTHGRSILEGIVEYSHEHRTWAFELCELSRGAVPPRWLAAWKGDGVIARLENRLLARAVAKLRLPVVDLSAPRLIPSAPVVETDDRAIAKLAAEHLLGLGLKHFAFCGDQRYAWSRYRQSHFQTEIHQAGFDCSVFNPPPNPNIEREYAAIGRWLASLPLPIGIMTCYDTRAHHVLEICRRERLDVPDTVAIVGVDNEPLICRLSSPQLTSIALNSKYMGYLAASLLDRMMSGTKVPPGLHLIGPVGLVSRQSTDLLRVDDPLVLRALRFIRKHAPEGINVRDVLSAVPASRRVLESRFKRQMRHTLHEEIIKVRVRRVEELLRESSLPLRLISERTGFEHPEYMSVMFKREVGIWPSEFRKRGRPTTRCA